MTYRQPPPPDLVDDYELAYGDGCPICGYDTSWETCWQCGGEGGHHECCEDCCACLDPEPNVTCEECHGEGGYLVCNALPHSEEQMVRWRLRQEEEHS